MKTLLAFNETIALVGDIDGTIDTELLPLVNSDEELRKYFYQKYREAGHWATDADHIDFHRVGDLQQTENFAVNILETTPERIPIKVYTDEESGLSVRAAFDPRTQRWVLAD